MTQRDRKSPPTTVAGSIVDGRVATLRAMRDRLARQIDDATTPATALASLVARMQAVLEELAALEPSTTTKGSPLDELAARRSGRGADTAGASASRSGKR